MRSGEIFFLPKCHALGQFLCTLAEYDKGEIHELCCIWRVWGSSPRNIWKSTLQMVHSGAFFSKTFGYSWLDLGPGGGGFSLYPVYYGWATWEGDFKKILPNRRKLGYFAPAREGMVSLPLLQQYYFMIYHDVHISFCHIKVWCKFLANKSWNLHAHQNLTVANETPRDRDCLKSNT